MPGSLSAARWPLPPAVAAAAVAARGHGRLALGRLGRGCCLTIMICLTRLGESDSVTSLSIPNLKSSLVKTAEK